MHRGKRRLEAGIVGHRSFQHRRQRTARQHCVDADALGRIIDRAAANEPHHAGLAGAIFGSVRNPTDAAVEAMLTIAPPLPASMAATYTLLQRKRSEERRGGKEWV